MIFHTKKIPEGEEYLYSTTELSNAIDEWLSKMPGITIIAINTVSAPGNNSIQQAAIITYTEDQKPAAS